MSTSAARHDRVQPEPLAVDARCTADALIVRLADGREASVPLEWFPRLRDATVEQRKRWRLIGGAWVFTGRTSTRISQSRASSPPPEL